MLGSRISSDFHLFFSDKLSLCDVIELKNQKMAGKVYKSFLQQNFIMYNFG